MVRVFLSCTFRAAIIVISAILVRANGAEPQPNDQEKARHSRWKAIYQVEAERYEIRLDQAPDNKLKMVPDPLLFYANPAGGQASHGAFYVWTHGGRAEVIGAIWSFSRDQKRRISHEIHSLSLGTLTSKHPDVNPNWEPREAGIQLAPIRGAGEIAATPALRLAQMRQLSREFVGFQTKDGIERPMRVLERPLFRYEQESSSGELIDGAVFGILMDWDPEIMLVIEARKTASGAQWQYAAARFSDKPLRIEHMGTQVWQVPATGRNNVLGGPSQRYYGTIGVSVRDDFTD